MTLTEALKIVRGAERLDVPAHPVSLACGFNSNHLETFIAAHVHAREATRRIELTTGLFGDLSGNIELGARATSELLIVIVEWGDLDQRLSLRTLGDWSPDGLADIVATVDARCDELSARLRGASSRLSTVVVLPTLPLPPMSVAPTWEAGSFELKLRARVAMFAADVAEFPGVRVIGSQRLDELSPFDGRSDLTADFVSGFPYSLKHASALAQVLAQAIYPPAPMKGLVVDLDNTLWHGVVGDDGVDGISWNLDGRSQIHGLFQCLLRSLSASGVLVAVASKNDPGVVERAFERPDMILRKDDVFPFEVGWGPKSESVGRILRSWNIGAEAVVFVDDSPMELAEVQAAYPSIETHLFPENDVRAAYALLRHLRDRFGKRRVTEEDRLRMASLRRAQPLDAPDSAALGESFLAQAEAVLTLDFSPKPGDGRPLELVNKTNQFNLNGKRHTELSWRSLASAPGSFLLVVSYSDKFGPLGKIAVVAGRVVGSVAQIETWVMSCRAFSRRIEFSCLRELLRWTGATTVALDYVRTDRNGPFDAFVGALFDGADPRVPTTWPSLAGRMPATYHRIDVVESESGVRGEPATSAPARMVDGQ